MKKEKEKRTIYLINLSYKYFKNVLPKLMQFNQPYFVIFFNFKMPKFNVVRLLLSVGIGQPTVLSHLNFLRGHLIGACKARGFIA